MVVLHTCAQHTQQQTFTRTFIHRVILLPLNNSMILSATTTTNDLIMQIRGRNPQRVVCSSTCVCVSRIDRSLRASAPKRWSGISHPYPASRRTNTHKLQAHTKRTDCPKSHRAISTTLPTVFDLHTESDGIHISEQQVWHTKVRNCAALTVRTKWTQSSWGCVTDSSLRL